MPNTTTSSPPPAFPNAPPQPRPPDRAGIDPAGVRTRKEVDPEATTATDPVAEDYPSAAEERARWERMAAAGDVDGLWGVLQAARPSMTDWDGLLRLLLLAVEARGRQPPGKE